MFNVKVLNRKKVLEINLLETRDKMLVFQDAKAKYILEYRIEDDGGKIIEHSAIVKIAHNISANTTSEQLEEIFNELEERANEEFKERVEKFAKMLSELKYKGIEIVVNIKEEQDP